MRENKDRKRFQERQAVLLKELEGLEKLESELKGKAGELHSQRKLLEALRPLHELLFFQGELAQRWHESFKPSGYGQNVGPWTDWVKRQDLKAVQGKAFAEMSRQLGNPLHHLSAIQELGVAGASTRVDLLERRFFQEVDGELAQRWDSGVKRLERLVKSDANVSKLVSEDGSLAGKVRTLLAGKPKPTVAMADKIAGNEKEYEQKRREFREGSEAMESSFAAREKELHDAKASLEIRRTGAGARIQETQARISGIEAGEAEHARQVGLWKRVRAEKRLLPAARFTTAELKALHALGQQLRDAPEVLAFRGF
ncbi:MAG TPA: hypothetical protein VJI67_00625, partial [archaeon]|nr:hypothetical protein [archaeon]